MPNTINNPGRGYLDVNGSTTVDESEDGPIPEVVVTSIEQLHEQAP